MHGQLELPPPPPFPPPLHMCTHAGCHCRLRNEAIVQWLTSRCNEETGTVVGAMLDAAARLEAAAAAGGDGALLLSEADVRSQLRQAGGAPADVGAVIE